MITCIIAITEHRQNDKLRTLTFVEAPQINDLICISDKPDGSVGFTVRVRSRTWICTKHPEIGDVYKLRLLCSTSL